VQRLFSGLVWASLHLQDTWLALGESIFVRKRERRMLNRGKEMGRKRRWNQEIRRKRERMELGRVRHEKGVSVRL